MKKLLVIAILFSLITVVAPAAQAEHSIPPFPLADHPLEVSIDGQQVGVTATAPNGQWDYTIPSGGPSTVDVATLPIHRPAGTLVWPEGVLQTALGTPLPGIDVVLYEFNGTSYVEVQSTTTDAYGDFYFDDYYAFIDEQHPITLAFEDIDGYWLINNYVGGVVFLPQ